MLLAALAAAYVDRRMAGAGLLPPAFRVLEASAGRAWAARRLAAISLLGLVFFVGIFLPMTTMGSIEPDFANLSRAQLFLLHGILLLTLVFWYLLGHGVRRTGLGDFARQFGLSSSRIWEDLGIGVVAGVAAWMVVLLVLISLGVLIWALGGEEFMPTSPPALVSWIAALPLGLRLALSLSAGFAEEIFFRGFLQPRAGVGFSTILFVLAHVGYGQPLMLVGVTLLSLVFAALVRWRQSIWSAVIAHAVFDALQLTVVIPKALEFLEGSVPG
jgi:membrane protease YdiL (CAAX protease family)